MAAQAIDLERALFRLLSKSARKGERADRSEALSRLRLLSSGEVDLEAVASSMEARIGREYADAPSLAALLGAAGEGEVVAAHGYDWVAVGIYVFGLPPTKTRPGTPASAAHRALKEWAASHPERLGATVDAVSATERWLPSGDEADVCFDAGGEVLAVEVRPSGAGEHELRQAVWACLKYRSVLEWELRLSGLDGSARSVVVTEDEPSPSVRELAEALAVGIVVGGPSVDC